MSTDARVELSPCALRDNAHHQGFMDDQSTFLIGAGSLANAFTLKCGCKLPSWVCTYNYFPVARCIPVHSCVSRIQIIHGHLPSVHVYGSALVSQTPASTYLTQTNRYHHVSR